jgi:hypothetical protein
LKASLQVDLLADLPRVEAGPALAVSALAGSAQVGLVQVGSARAGLVRAEWAQTESVRAESVRVLGRRRQALCKVAARLFWCRVR